MPPSSPRLRRPAAGATLADPRSARSGRRCSSATAVTATRCCIAGGGPAGMMLGFLLARAGVPTVVLEKHADFLRDFRGDTVHPSTLRIMDELGLLDDFLQRPHQRLRGDRAAVFGDERVQLGDFSGLPERYAFIAMMPQWEFLDFLADEAKKLPAFALRMQADVTGSDRGRRPRRRRARHVARGRRSRSAPTARSAATAASSTVRAAAGLAVEDVGAPIDVLWFRVGRDPAASSTRPWPGSRPATSSSPSTAATTGSAPSSFPRAAPRRCGSQPIEVFRAQVVASRAAARGRTSRDVRSWNDVKLLTVAVDRLTRLVEARAALHRRRGACDVAGRRRRHQPGDPGCGRRRQPARRQAARRRTAHRGRPRRGAARAASGRPRRRRRCRSRSRTTCWCR